MKPLVNLANQPFSNRRLLWLAIGLFFAVPSYFGLQALGNMAALELEISKQTEITTGLEAQLKKVDKPVKTNVAISIDRNRELLVAGDLITRRAFSWSQLLSDIERNLPGGVRVIKVGVTQILPQEKDGTIGDDVTASLSLVVVGKSNLDVTMMINKFQESGRFKVVPVAKKQLEGVNDVEFTLKVDYAPPTSANPPSNNQVASGQVAERNQ
ncbi:MAG TPA: hypothetical protein VJ302_22310 [Blastocatellia bacterium]|nr:hypothetical protein [Blastocatellia bacterium]